MAISLPLKGGCFCGEVRYEIDGPLSDPRSCHCSLCRKAFSGQASAYGLVDPESFAWVSGSQLLASYVGKAGFGLTFCSQCGSTLCGTFNGKVHGITLGCLDGDPDIGPLKHLFVGSKARWEVIPEGVKQYVEHEIPHLLPSKQTVGGKVATKTEYFARIDMALRYIEANLSGSISLSDIADASHFSPFHFHRIFAGVVGESVNAYVSRRRLEKAANALVFSRDLSITHIAFAYGFSSSSNFSKAIKLHFGFSPSDIRHPERAKHGKIGKILSKYGKEFDPSRLYPHSIANEAINPKTNEDKTVNIEVRDLPSQRVCLLSSDRGYEPGALFRTWDKVIDWAAHKGLESSAQNRFGFAHDNPSITPVDRCRYDAGIVVNDSVRIESPFKESTIPGGKYAVLYFKGQPEETLQAQLSIYSEWFPESGFEPDHFPMLERYLNDQREDGFVEMEVYVKLKELKADK